MKRCTKCGQSQPEGNFYMQKQYYKNQTYIFPKSWCKRCELLERSKYYSSNRKECQKKNREYMKEYRQNPLYKKKQAAYYQKWYKEKGRTRNAKQLELIHNWRIAHPESCQAAHIVRYALQVGKIHKPNQCTVCQENKKIIAHHQDYTMPLDVMWLCHSCHQLLHKYL